MWALFRKEIQVFFSTLIGYITIAIFLLVNALVLWLLPVETNILDGGYATLESLFSLAPWLYLILIPGITMRSFADENKGGTLELLFTMPLSTFSVVMSKFLACLVVLLFSLLPTLIYFYSIHEMAYPIGNVDTGATWGSYFGLFMLGAGFISIGTFASALSSNQIISLFVSIALCLLIFLGLDSAGDFFEGGKVGHLLKQLSINAHYNSVSRGVIDTRDILYFVALIAFFMLLTITRLNSRKW